MGHHVFINDQWWLLVFVDFWAGSPMPSVYEDTLITILRTAPRPDYTIIFMDNKLELAACFVLNKEQLVVSILGQLLFGCLIIGGILIL
jgi:hypothetical protein